RLAATWDHDRRLHASELAGLPSIEAAMRATAADLAAEGLTDRAAVVDGDVRLTAAQLEDRVRHLAAGLATRGVGHGDAVCFQLPNWWEAIAAFRACWTLGAIAVPVHHLAAAGDVARIIGEVTPALVLSAPGLPASALDGAIEV